MKTWLETTLKKHLGRGAVVTRIEKIQGDASYRVYSRIHVSDQSTLILVQMPKGKAEASEEITKAGGLQEADRELPFINIGSCLARRGLPVPKILHYDPEEALLLLEDLGSTTLASCLERAGAAERMDLYRRSVDLLVTLQKSMETPDPLCIAFQRSYDAQLLNWEFHHFREFAIEAARGRPLAAGDRNIFEEAATNLTEQIMKIPRGFVHRDYQSRNLMRKNENFYMIDFQDALVGPYLYDLVALLRDSYSALSSGELASLVEYFRAERQNAGLATDSLEKIWEGFHLVTIQRKLKDAGRFVYIDRVKGNPSFLQFIPTSLRYARDALLALPKNKDCGRLLGLIQSVTPEWPHNS